MFQQVDNRWKLNITSAMRPEFIRELTQNDYLRYTEQLRDSITEDIAVLDKVQRNLEN